MLINDRHANKRIMLVLTLFLLISVLFCSFSAMAKWNSIANLNTKIRNYLWTQGGEATVSNAEILTVSALVRYARDGVFGNTCQYNIETANLNNIKTIDDVGTKCPAAKEFYEQASAYAGFVDARMKQADPTGQRLENAMIRFSDLAGEIFAILTGFGLLTSILVFVVIFMRLSWMPSHSYQRRQVMMEIATSGACVMLLGNMWLIMSLFQSIFNRFWQTFAVYSKDWRTVANMVLAEYKGFITGLSGIATLIVLAMFIVNFMTMALDADNQVIGYEFVKLGKMMEDIRHGMSADEALKNNTGNYGRFADAVKYIDPREE
mgnify:CR=1 FL=1